MILSSAMRRVLAAFILTLSVSPLSAGCVSGDVDEEKPLETVPEGIHPEDATFRYVPLDHESKVALEVRLSTIPLCRRDDVPDGHRFVKLEIAVPVGTTIGPGTYPLKQDLGTRIHLLRMFGPQCASSAGSVAAAGYVLLDEVGDDVVRGSFVGTNPDSKIDLRGEFVATHCAGITTCE